MGIYTVLTHRLENHEVDTVTYRGPRAKSRAVEFATMRPKALILPNRTMQQLEILIDELTNETLINLLQEVRNEDSTSVTVEPEQIKQAFYNTLAGWSAKDEPL